MGYSMPSPSKVKANAPASGDWTAVALQFLASLKLAVALLVILVIVLATATIIELDEGAGFVLWYIYGSPWFAGLLGLLAANIVAAAVVRYPWKSRHIGFLITHAGILVLLLGSMLTLGIMPILPGKIEGRLELLEGEAGDHISLTDHGQFNVQWQDAPDHPARAPASFGFKPGLVDWPEGKKYDLGEESGVHLRVTKYFCRARVEQNWVADESQDGLPALKIALAGNEDVADDGHWLIAGPFGSAEAMGPLQIEFHRVKAATMCDDFLNPPAAKEMDPSGVLSVHYDGKVQRIPVGPNIGKKVPLGDGKVSVEVVEYLPNAKPGPGKPGTKVNFVSEGTEPKDPLLELLIHVEGEKEPIRQIAFARVPFQSFDGMHGRSSPVKFWYHHPAVLATPGVQFMQTPDGKLYGRVGIDGQYQPRGLLREGDVIKLPDKVRVAIAQHLPSARQEVSFHSVPFSADERGAPPPAVRLDVTAGGETQEVWLRHKDPQHGVRRINTPEGQLTISFGDFYYPLKYSLRLLKLNQAFDPGGMGEPAISSTVRLVDKTHEIDEEREIAMNRPLIHGGFWYSLIHGGFWFYQTAPIQMADGRLGSVLTVATDPGRILKYLGCMMICAGALFMFFKKAPFGRPAAKEETPSSSRAAPSRAEVRPLNADQS